VGPYALASARPGAPLQTLAGTAPLTRSWDPDDSGSRE